MVDLSAVPGLPAPAVASLTQFNELIETYAQHRLPKEYVEAIIGYTAMHGGAFLLVVPIFARQILSGRFWIVRLVSTPRGRIIVPNHLDCSAVLIGAYVLYDLAWHIRLLLAVYGLTNQYSFPAMLFMRFVLLLTVGWIFLICFFLVLVPPSSFNVPAYVWNIGIFGLPICLHFGALFVLIEANQHWNHYWLKYETLSTGVRQALASGATLPTTEQIITARQMLGIDLSRYSHATRNWALVYYAYTVLFSSAMIFVTVKIVRNYWSQLKDDESLPMQSGRPRTLNRTSDRSNARSLTTSAGIQKWVNDVPHHYSGRTDTQHLQSTASGYGTESESQVGKESSTKKQALSPGFGQEEQRQHRPTGRRLLTYMLGLNPLHKDAYDDPTRGFSEDKAIAGMRSLLIHTAVQGAAVVLITVIQLLGIALVTRHGYLQPLASSPQVAGRWGYEWVQVAGIFSLLEAYGTGLPGMVMITSVLMRQWTAINLSQARANQGVAGLRRDSRGGGGTAADLQLSAPGPSISAVIAAQQASFQVRSQRNEADRGLRVPFTMHEDESLVASSKGDDCQADSSLRDGSVGNTDSWHARSLSRPPGEGRRLSTLADDTVVDDR